MIGPPCRRYAATPLCRSALHYRRVLCHLLSMAREKRRASPVATFIFQSSVFIVLSALCSNAQVGPGTHWVGSWASSQQLVEPQNLLAINDLRDATLRQVVHLSIGGSEIRVHLSNRFGTEPMTFNSVHVARAVAPGSSKIDPTTDKALTFSAFREVVVP